MTNRQTIQSYINNFRRRIAKYLKPGVGLACTVHPATRDGAILEFRIGESLENDDVYLPPAPNLGSALSTIQQRAFGGNLEGFRFSGTNVILEPGRLIFIKDDSPAEWTDAAATRDVERIAQTGARSGV